MDAKSQRSNVSRYLGLSLGGAKSDRTSLAIIDLYTEQKKLFLVDVLTDLGADEDQTADQVLVGAIEKFCSEADTKVLAVDVPLTYPPCLHSCEKDCSGYETCKRPEVKWMRNYFTKAKEKNSKLKHFTPYTQRPVDLYFRIKFQTKDVFQDDTMGANLAPQAARMSYLKKFLKDLNLVEVWPKLVLYHIHRAIKVSKSDVMGYRNIERGSSARENILEHLVRHSPLFVYERDMKRLVSNVGAFDALICAWIAMLHDQDQTEVFDEDLPLESGWIELPRL
ncbi:MAG: DUF429 domain-containing protein [Bacteriovoracia bacterium]